MLKILLPTDFSANAQKAIDYAFQLFKKEECTFYVLHAYHDAPSAPKSRTDLEKELEQLVENMRINEQHPKHRFKSVFMVDSVVNALNVTAIDNAIDYIFMGTKGSTSLMNVFMGSNTVRAIKQVHACPIIAIPLDFDNTTPKQIAFANNFRHRFIPEELSPLIKMAKLWNATVSIIHIYSKKELDEDQKLNKEVLINILKEIKTVFHEVQMDVSVTSSLVRFEKEHSKMDMVALLKTKHGFLHKLLSEPVIRKIVFNTEVPFMVFPQSS
ncbi:universal stress protein [Maribacter sp. TH_r10]|uniref:UspA domain-containing protein n=1 Tax=Maribacter luteus TaxID=2594478 RepID=A0A6I2MIK9_9FLAO|nr:MULTISPECIES: universal stress protein [Maribacter]MDV7139817.1 universal stress protein [Maribacter sp. TH_r10]MRX63538.1 hypothetical protein [Maribacter luteus]